MSKKIIIYGAYDDGNFGDDLLLFMILDWLEEYNFINNIYVSSSKSDLKKHYKTINLLDKNIAKNQSCDLFIITYFVHLVNLWFTYLIPNNSS